MVTGTCLEVMMGGMSYEQLVLLVSIDQHQASPVCGREAGQGAQLSSRQRYLRQRSIVQALGRQGSSCHHIQPNGAWTF